MIGIIILLILLYIRYHNRYIESFTNLGNSLKKGGNQVSSGVNKFGEDTQGLANDAGAGAGAAAGAAGKAIVGAGELVGGGIKDGLGEILGAIGGAFDGAWPPIGFPDLGGGLTCGDGDGECKLACIIQEGNIDECITSKIDNMVTKFKADLNGLFTNDWVKGKMPNVSSSSANFSLGYSSGVKNLPALLENMTGFLLNFKEEFWKNLAMPIKTVTIRLWDETIGRYLELRQ